MKIACLAWGSLLWKSGPLKLRSPWHDDGPALPLEFCRVGDGGELATALCERSAPQRSWWALLDAASLEEAREQLRQREEIDVRHPEWVGTHPWPQAFPLKEAMAEWMSTRDLDAMVWTALRPRYEGQEGRVPTSEEAVRYLGRLAGDTRNHAESYIRQMPARFSTATRSEIERRLGWYESGPAGSSS